MIKIFLIILISFINIAYADDISDFELEGFSVNASLLDFLSEDQILKKTEYELEQKNNKQMGFVSFNNIDMKSDNFLLIKAWYNTKDPEYKIKSISAFVDTYIDIDKCLVQKDKIVNEVKNIFTNTERYDEGWAEHAFDKNSRTNITYFLFTYTQSTSSFIRIGCYDWSKSTGYDDQLRIEITTEDYYNWLFNLHSSLN